MLAILLILLTNVLPFHASDLSNATKRELVRQIPSFGGAEWVLSPVTGKMQLVPALDELRRRLERGDSLQLAEWQTILVEKGYLRHRRNWLAAEPFAIALHLPALYSGLGIQLIPRKAGWKPAKAAHWEMMCGLAMDIQRRTEDYQQLGILSPDDHTLLFDLIVTTPPSMAGGVQTRTDRLGPISIEVEAVERFEDVLAAVTDSTVTEKVRRGLSLRKGQSRDGVPCSQLAFASGDWPANLALHLEVTLIRGDKAVEVKSALRLKEEPRGLALNLERLPLSLFRNSRGIENWKIKVRGLPRDTPQCWEATSYWAGEFEISVSELMRR